MGWDVWVGEIRRRPWGLEVKYNDWGKLTVITAWTEGVGVVCALGRERDVVHLGGTLKHP